MVGLHSSSDTLHLMLTILCLWLLLSQDVQLNEMRSMIKVLQEDCKSLANALTQICNAGAGADISSVLQTLPPTLVQVRSLTQSVVALCHLHQLAAGKHFDCGLPGVSAGLPDMQWLYLASSK